MDSMRGHVKVLRHHIPYNDHEKIPPVSVNAIDALIDTCSSLHVPPSLDRIVSLKQKIYQVRKRIDEVNRQQYTSLNKLSRSIDQVFPDNVEDLIPPELFQDHACKQALDLAVFEYLTRTGEKTIANKFLKVRAVFSYKSVARFCRIELKRWRSRPCKI